MVILRAGIHRQPTLLRVWERWSLDSIVKGKQMIVRITVLLAVMLLAVCANAQQTPANATQTPTPAAKTDAVLTTDKDKMSYSIGVTIGKNLQQQQADLNAEALAKGLKDVLTGGKLLLTDAELGDAMNAFQKDMIEKHQKAMDALADKNKKDGAAFLAANKTKPGVITLASGLQYKIVKAGNGKKPTAEDKVECNYRGTLVDGTEFDSSANHGGPATFPVSGVIPGWTEALKLMPVGSKWQLFIPSQLAYGERGAGESIGPDATLIFDIELLSIK
jgi:FKBP-type peptidyl-prolyl cis-trans isomerase FklB